MSTLGKVLSFLNILAAIGFFFLVAADWGKRHDYAYAVFRRDLILNGLPVDADETDVHGDRLVDDLTEETLKDALGGTGPAVKTQIEEVNRRYTQVKQDIDSAPDDAAKRAKLAAIVLPLERVGSERNRIRKEILSEPLDKLLGSDGPLEQVFHEAKDGRAGKDGSPLDREPRRQAIALLLFGLAREEAEQKRALAVTGLKSYIRAVDTQTNALREITQRVNLAMADDRHAFEVQHRQQLHRIELVLERIASLQTMLNTQKGLVAKHQTILEARKGDVKDLTEQLAVAKEQKQAAQQLQAKLEKELFDAQKMVGDALAANERLEQAIRTAETGR